MDIKAITEGFRESLHRVVGAIKGFFKGKSVTSVVDSEQELGPHQKRTGIHYKSLQKIVTPVDVKPRMKPVTSEHLDESGAEARALETANLHLTMFDGSNRPLKGIPLNAPVALLRTQLTQEIGTSASRLTKIMMDGKEVDDSQPIWSCVHPERSTMVDVQPIGAKEDLRNLDSDIQLLMEESRIFIFNDQGSVVDQLDDFVHEFSLDVIAGKMEPDDENFTDLQGYIASAIDCVDVEEDNLKDKEYARAYLTQLSQTLNIIQTYNVDSYRPATVEEPSSTSNSTIHIDAVQLRKAVRGESVAAAPVFEKGAAQDSQKNGASTPLQFSKSGEEYFRPVNDKGLPGLPAVQNNLGFIPYPRLVIESDDI
ncbi:hypothetical protein ACH42_03800 [Endozoicomonas sp. (ex Bugula neritina AB1)]|nr:hypothetical protein ACH42_03800 [Endozoicomonas sp. (ex Bugula neritina AB1)]